MIDKIQIESIKQYAYVPEHIISYVTAVSGCEPFILDEFLAYVKNHHLIFIGYPLKGPSNEKRIKESLEKFNNLFHPTTVSISSPLIPFPINKCIHSSPGDYYYRLDLKDLSISQKTRNMVQRARKELLVEVNKNYDEEHQRIVRTFIESRQLEEETKFILGRIKEYISYSNESWIFNVRNKSGNLIAFDIAEFGAKDYAFYMFNFRSSSHYIPGASDLLLFEIINMARAENKRYINLGLGINSGVRFFKKKWGGIPFLPHFYCIYKPSGQERIERLLYKL
jgi:hypothetical protein